MNTQPNTQWNPAATRPAGPLHSVLLGLVYAAAGLALFAVVSLVCMWTFFTIAFSHATFG